MSTAEERYERFLSSLADPDRLLFLMCGAMAAVGRTACENQLTSDCEVCPVTRACDVLEVICRHVERVLNIDADTLDTMLATYIAHVDILLGGLSS